MLIMINNLFTTVFPIIDIILFFIFASFTIYLLIFALSSLNKHRVLYIETSKKYKYAIIIPITSNYDYFPDNLNSLMKIDYPEDKFDIIISYNKKFSKIVEKISELPIKFIEYPEKQTTKGKQLNFTLQVLNKAGEKYDAIILLDSYDIVHPSFLNKINNAFYHGGITIQTHLKHKETDTSINIISAINDEINNSLFRRGHVNLGFSSSLLSSGIVFSYEWLVKNLPKIEGIDFTKEIESLLLNQGEFIEYLEDVQVIENIETSTESYNNMKNSWSKRDRILKNNTFGTRFVRNLFNGNFDYCNKRFQWILPSRILLPVYIIIITLITLSINPGYTLKWIILLFLLFQTYVMCIPFEFFTLKTTKAILKIPSIIFNQLIRNFKK